jgi:hypothetical protein
MSHTHIPYPTRRATDAELAAVEVIEGRTSAGVPYALTGIVTEHGDSLHVLMYSRVRHDTEIIPKAEVRAPHPDPRGGSSAARHTARNVS